MIKKAKKIQRLVEQILNQNSLSSPPIDVFSISKNRGIEIVPSDLGDISGILFREGNRITIGINQTHPETRKRFTVAHELGHLILHGDQPLHVDKVFAIKLRSHVSSEAVDLEEIEANAFAAELLMPTGMMQQKLQDLPGVLDYEKETVISKLAKDFKVSPQAMTIRLINLGYISDAF